LVDDDLAEEDDTFELDLKAVDVVSFALAVVSLGSLDFNALGSLDFNAFVFESIPVSSPFCVGRVLGRCGLLVKRIMEGAEANIVLRV